MPRLISRHVSGAMVLTEYATDDPTAPSTVTCNAPGQSGKTYVIEADKPLDVDNRDVEVFRLLGFHTMQ